jgi:hypothetical protein
MQHLANSREVVIPNTDNGIPEDPSAGSASASSGATSLDLGES